MKQENEEEKKHLSQTMTVVSKLKQLRHKDAMSPRELCRLCGVGLTDSTLARKLRHYASNGVIRRAERKTAGGTSIAVYYGNRR